MPSKRKAELAREHLARAETGVEGSDATEAVTWLLAALEAAIVSMAEATGMQTPTHHWKKAEVASELYDRGRLAEDYADLLDLLNSARKRAVYDGDQPDLGSASLDDLLARVESAVVAAEQDLK